MLRILASLVTGITMALGGAALAWSGAPIVAALGITSVVVGAAYAWTGVNAELRTSELPPAGRAEPSPDEATELASRSTEMVPV